MGGFGSKFGRAIGGLWNGDNIPQAPTSSDLNHSTPINVQDYNPNTGVFTGVNPAVPRTRNADYRPGLRNGQESGSAWDRLAQSRTRFDQNQVSSNHTAFANIRGGTGLTPSEFLSIRQTDPARFQQIADQYGYTQNVWGQNQDPGLSAMALGTPEELAAQRARAAAGPQSPGYAVNSTGTGYAAAPPGAAAPPPGSVQGAPGYIAPVSTGNGDGSTVAPGYASPVAMGSVRGDESGMAAARAALAQMQERSQTGWSALDRMALDQAQRQAGQYEQSQRGANQASMASRGMRGSGLEMLGAMNAQQGGADRALDAATTLGVQGRNLANQNTANAANLGQSINDTMFNQAAARAAAIDGYNQYATSKQDSAAAQVYAAGLGRFSQVQQQRQNIMGGVTQGAQMLGGIFGGI